MKALLISFLLLSTPVMAQTFETAFSPRQGATKIIVDQINHAGQTINIAAYGFTSRPIIDALCQAAARNVEVNAVIDKSQEKGEEPAAAGECGVNVKFNGKYAIMHNKFMIIDGDTLELGSFNYTGSAEKNNAENVLIIHDAPGVVKAYTEQFNKLWGESK